MNIDQDIFDKLTDDQKKKIIDAKNPDELIKIAKETGYELSQDDLDAIAGGEWNPCPHYMPCVMFCPTV